MIAAMATAEGLIPYPEKAGLASSLMGFIRTLAGGLAGILYGMLYDGTPNPMLYAITVAGLSGAVVYGTMLRPAGEVEDSSMESGSAAS